MVGGIAAVMFWGLYGPLANADVFSAGTAEGAAIEFTLQQLVGAILLGVVLFLSALVSAPWQSIDIVAIFWGLAGLGGMVYCAVVLRRMRLQSAYRPVFEDCLFHALLPLAAYTMLAISAIVIRSHLRPSLYFVGCSALVFLFVGIHNA